MAIMEPKPEEIVAKLWLVGVTQSDRPVWLNKPIIDALKRRGSLAVCFDPEMMWRPHPSGKRGRHHHFSDAAIEPAGP